MQIRSTLPGPDHIDGQTIVACGHEGFIVNMYVERSARRLGLARELMKHALQWAYEHGIHPIRLRASQEGRPLYEQLGFQATADMMKWTDQNGQSSALYVNF
jgi:GNAT superfamily N-acetyltransferase